MEEIGNLNDVSMDFFDENEATGSENSSLLDISDFFADNTPPFDIGESNFSNNILSPSLAQFDTGYDTKHN